MHPTGTVERELRAADAARAWKPELRTIGPARVEEPLSAGLRSYHQLSWRLW